MIEQVRYRLATESDRKEILDLLNTVFSQQQQSIRERDDTFWKWKYESNVFGKAILIIGELGDKIIANGTLWPWQFKYKDKILNAYQTCDGAVHPDYRGQGVFSSINKERVIVSQKEHADFLFSFPNKNSLPAYLSSGWSINGRIGWSIKPLKPLGIITNYLSNNKVINVGIMDSHALSHFNLYEIDKYSVQNDSLSVYKKDGFYEWRYSNHPTRKYGIVVYNEGEGNKAAAIFTIQKRGEIYELIVVDYIGSPGYIGQVFKLLLKAAKDYNAAFIAVMRNNQLNTNKLWKMGYSNLKQKNFTSLPLSLNLEPKITNFKEWSLIAGMHDSI